MKFEVSERIVTAKSETEVLSILLDQFKTVASSAKLDGGSIIVKSIEASFGSAHRSDTTTVSLRNDNGTYLVVAKVNYRPSAFMFIFLLVFLTTVIGFFIPIIFYTLQKKTVREGIENVFQRVKNELQTTHSLAPAPTTTQSVASQLKELNQVHKEGGLTDAEYQQMKDKLMKAA